MTSQWQRHSVKKLFTQRSRVLQAFSVASLMCLCTSPILWIPSFWAWWWPRPKISPFSSSGAHALHKGLARYRVISKALHGTGEGMFYHPPEVIHIFGWGYAQSPDGTDNQLQRLKFCGYYHVLHHQCLVAWIFADNLSREENLS